MFLMSEAPPYLGVGLSGWGRALPHQIGHAESTALEQLCIVPSHNPFGRGRNLHRSGTDSRTLRNLDFEPRTLLREQTDGGEGGKAPDFVYPQP